MSETVQTCFCLEEIARSKRNLCQLREQLPKVRNQYDQYRGTGLNRERDTLVELQSIVKRLWEEFPLLIQQLNEYGDAELIQITGKDCLYEPYVLPPNKNPPADHEYSAANSKKACAFIREKQSKDNRQNGLRIQPFSVTCGKAGRTVSAAYLCNERSNNSPDA